MPAGTKATAVKISFDVPSTDPEAQVFLKDVVIEACQKPGKFDSEKKHPYCQQMSFSGVIKEIFQF